MKNVQDEISFQKLLLCIFLLEKFGMSSKIAVRHSISLEQLFHQVSLAHLLVLFT